MDIGRSFTEQAASYDVTSAVQEAADQGRQVYVKVGGKVYKVPKSRANDAAALMVDLNARFKVSKRKGGSPRPLGLELSYGAGGVLVNLDRVEQFDPELEEEFGDLGDDAMANDLAAYIARASSSYLGAEVDAADVREAWEENDVAGFEDIDDDEDDE